MTVCAALQPDLQKNILADQLAPLPDAMFNASDISALSAWVGAIAYIFQIYFDFSGYSDMAIGLGKIFGFEFAQSFNYPYISRSIQEFWRRWHISLSTWFKDYVYIPLGGSRNGTWRTYRNLIIVFFSQDSGTRAVGILLSGAYTMCCFSSLSGWAVMSFWIGCRGFCSTSIRCLSSWWAGLSSGQKIWKTRCTT